MEVYFPGDISKIDEVYHEALSYLGQRYASDIGQGRYLKIGCFLALEFGGHFREFLRFTGTPVLLIFTKFLTREHPDILTTEGR